MPKFQTKALLTGLSVTAAVLILWNIVLTLGVFFPNSLSFAGKGSSEGGTEDLSELDLAIDKGIDRYLARQQENERKAQEDQEKQAAEKAKNVLPPQPDDFITGNKNAEIVLIEYSDFECPYCLNFHKTARELIEKNENVAWIYRQYPLSIHPGAQKKAEASECVGKLGGNEAFWKFADAIFQEGTQFKVENLGDLAERVGVERTAFQTCLDSGEMENEVNKDLQGGLSAGVSGTPGNILLNTKTGEVRVLRGAVPLAVEEAAVKELLE